MLFAFPKPLPAVLFDNFRCRSGTRLLSGSEKC
jgi:hypothetical protein